MTSLKSKLARLQMPGAPAAPTGPTRGAIESDARATSPQPGGEAEAFTSPDRQTRLQRLRAQMSFVEQREAERDRRPPRGPYTLGEGLPGECSETPAGLLRCVRTELAEDHHHGTAPVVGALSACAQELSVLALDPSLAGVDLSSAVYIDTETTGLAGGAGTVPFLIGVAWFEQRRLIVEQYLLEQLGQEGPMLRRLSEHLERASCVVSYNGKSFDWPLLRTRFVMHRVPVKPPAVHLDLLHCARRVFKRRLGAVRLVHIEEQVLGFERVDDIPGSLIPETYLGYLRQRVPGEALSPIVEHNKSDLIALAALLGELSRRFAAEGHGQDVRDQLGMAQVAARARQTDRAIAMATAAADADARGELASHAAWLSGRWAKQRGDWDGAQRGFVAAVEHARDAEEAARAHLDLAKLHEHQTRDWDAALAHALYTEPVEGDAAHARRLARLRRKIDKVRG